MYWLFKKHEATEQHLSIIEPCSTHEVIHFFTLLRDNAHTLNYTLLFKKTSNDMTKIKWSFVQTGYDWGTEYTFYIPQEGSRFYSHKDRYYGCDYLLYKNRLHNDSDIIYLLIYNHSGSSNYGGIVGAWIIDTTIVREKDIHCFFQECPEHIAEDFVVKHNGKIYLKFIAWEQAQQLEDDDAILCPVIRYYLWQNYALECVVVE